MLFMKTFWTGEEGGKEKKKGGGGKSTVGLKIAQVGGYPALCTWFIYPVG